MTAPASSLRIRPVTDADIPALFDICLKTANAGEDGSALFSDHRLPGYLWAVPYAKFEPDFAFVLAGEDAPIGYVLGGPDTQALRQRLEADWWPWVQSQVAGLVPTRPMDSPALSRIAKPEGVRMWLQQDYPAHLHINILPEAQSAGWGRRMIETELMALRQRGVRGVHLGVMPDNHRAIGFYRRLGFEEIGRDHSIIFGMKLGN